MAVQCVLVGKGKDDVFTAVYGETTFDKVLKAYNENKVVQVIYQNRIYYLDNTTVVNSPEAFSFTSTFSNQNDETGEIKYYVISLMTGDSWSGPFLQKSTPATHANTHAKNGIDPLSPADIGAMELSENILKQSNEDITSQVAQALSGDLVPFSGGTMTGLLNVLAPVGDSNATTKKYVDDAIKNNSGMRYESNLLEKPSSPVSNLDNYSWEDINNIALSGKAKEYFTLGATKNVTLNNAVLGTTTCNVMIIGINQDNDNSITFQTQNCLHNNFSFSKTQWIDSNARIYCQDFYNAFPEKDYILTVSKGTCPDYSSSRNASVTYNDETVWLPSEREMGLDSYSSLSVANSTISNAECTKGKNFSYEYYNNNNKRIKKNGDSGNAVSYWERSRAYNYTRYVCCVGSNGEGIQEYDEEYKTMAPAFVIGHGTISGKIIQNNKDITSKVIETVGGAKIQVLSYIGTGTYGSSNPNLLTFDFIPKIVTIGYIDYQYSSDEYPYLRYINFIYPAPQSSQSGRSGSYYMYHNVKWKEETLIWYASGSSPSSSGQLNESNKLYYVVAIG